MGKFLVVVLFYFRKCISSNADDASQYKLRGQSSQIWCLCCCHVECDGRSDTIAYRIDLIISFLFTKLNIPINYYHLKYMCIITLFRQLLLYSNIVRGMRRILPLHRSLSDTNKKDQRFWSHPLFLSFHSFVFDVVCCCIPISVLFA